LQSAKRLATLYKLSQRISANLQPDEVYHAIHKATKDLMACDSFILSLYDEATQTINDVYFVDHAIPQKLTSRPMGVGLASKVITEKKTVFYNHFNINMVKRTNAVLVGEDKDESVVRSLIIVPLKLGKTVKGIMSTQSYSADAYSQEDKETLELLASHAVIALENSTLFSEVQELAITDSLTKVNNRRRFFDLAEQEFERSRRYNRPLSLIMLDIDHFKRVNDTYGHAAGDTVLEQLAQLCQKSLREVDVFARYGGEEFVILLPETTSIEAQLTAERIRQLVARTPIEITGDSLTITISFGIVELDKDCKNVEELLDRSDQAMYASKRNGRNRVSIWGPSTPKLLNSN
jgi:diguanylate cyclase (GGDEF)-like protein